MSVAHDLNAKPRTKDVLIEEQLNFNTLLLSDKTLQGLQRAGFQKPSPIQLKAIPIGKCGFDLMIESKSGTGKTAVFAIIALELIKLTNTVPQVLILAPTREVAVQICDVLQTLGAGYKGLKVRSFIGGFPVEEDTKKLPGCHIVVGAPGRIKHLIKMGALKVSSVKLFVLDEVDKLLDQNFQPDVNDILKTLPRVKQIITLSATYTDELKLNLEKLMYSPSFISPNTGSPLLLGLKQFVSVVKCNLNVIHQMNIKNEELMRLLQKVSFSQCIIFFNYQTRAESISNILNRNGWKSMYISGAQTQSERLQVINSLKKFKCRILLSTDITARGIDASNVDLIINYDVPNDASIYLHRMGRAGRYGSYGACITLAADGNDLSNFQVLIGNIGGTVMSVPKFPNNDEVPADLLNCDLSKFEAVFGIVDVAKSTDGSVKLDISKSLTSIKNSQRQTNIKQDKSAKKEEGVNKSLDNNQNSEDMMNIDNIHMLLDMKIQNEKSMESQVANLESHDLLNSLASGKQINIQDSVPVTDVNEESLLAQISNSQLNDVWDSKKRKRNDTKCDNAVDPVSNNSKLRKDWDARRDKICLKNIALLNVTKLLVNDFNISTIENETVEAVSVYLNMLKNDDQLLINNNVNLKTKEDILLQISEGVSCTLDTSSLKNEVQLTEHEASQGGSCTSDMPDLKNKRDQTIEQNENHKLEKIFQLGFDYAVNPNAPYWLDVLGEDFQEQVDLGTDEQDFIQVDKRNSYSDEEVDESYSHKKRNKHKRHHKKKSHRNEVNKTKQDLDGNKNFVDWYPGTHKDDLNQLDYNSYPGLYSEYEHCNNEHFTKCFEYYNCELAEKAETFEDTASFEEWFSQWQYQVQGVRDYIQQHVYLQEMNRYALNKN